MKLPCPRYAKDLAVPKRIRTLAEQAQDDDHLHLSYLAQSGGKLHAAISSMGAVCAGTYATLSATAVCAMERFPSKCNMFTSSAKTWIFAGMTATSLLGMGAYSVFKGRKHSKQAEKSYQEMLQHQRETRQGLLLHYTKLANAVKDLSKEEIQALQKQLPIMEQEIDSLNLKWISKQG